jgi:hypothetical protein
MTSRLTDARARLTLANQLEPLLRDHIRRCSARHLFSRGFHLDGRRMSRALARG